MAQKIGLLCFEVEELKKKVIKKTEEGDENDSKK